ncbi:MAG: hypothetical protein K2M17_01865 [Bacilli bacterium]|nr:hypothetical protein [Bacilli bacterium]
MEIVEVGIKLGKDFNYYDNFLKTTGFVNDFNIKTHDIYYTNKNLDSLSENEMKNACIRIRSCNDGPFKVQNNLLKELDINEVSFTNLIEFEKQLLEFGYKKIFDTLKYDHHYYKEDMNSKIQLQEIEDIGLLVYYDNSLYSNMSIREQRRKLIDELNSYGFDEIHYGTLGLDKLRTLYYKKECYSQNQNG